MSADRTAHVSLAASEAARVELEAQGVPDVRLWRGGVDLHRFHPRRADPAMRARLTGGHPERRLVLYVGRLAAEKGVARLLPLASPGAGRVARWSANRAMRPARLRTWRADPVRVATPALS